MGKSVHSGVYIRLVLALVAARRDAGVTQAVLASRLRKPQSFVSKYESSERRLDVLEFLEICRALDMDDARLTAILVDAATSLQAD